MLVLVLLDGTGSLRDDGGVSRRAIWRDGHVGSLPEHGGAKVCACVCVRVYVYVCTPAPLFSIALRVCVSACVCERRGDTGNTPQFLTGGSDGGGVLHRHRREERGGDSC